jgi:hypothetical protein
MFKLNLTNHFQTYLLFTFIVPKFLEFCNHLTINSKKGTMFLLCYLKLFSIYFLLFVSKIEPFFTIFFKSIVSIYFNMFSPNNYVKICIKYLPKIFISTSFQEAIIMTFCLITLVTITFKMLLDLIY